MNPPGPAPSPTIDVSTSLGVVCGARDGEVVRYLGIPYAEAPVGPRRFSLPVARSPWSDPFDATRLGPTMPQSPYGGGLEQHLPTVRIAGDDTLNLNIWAPADRSEPLPVMVWIHGGAFSRGSNALEGYDGSRFARDGVVFVAINYRLGLEGFSVLDGAPRNLGLADQVAALEWVQREIAAFGGDPRQVTLVGQSAGGNSVAALIANPVHHALVARAIIQSGPLTARPPEVAARMTTLVAKDLGIPATRDAFAAQSPEALVAAQDRVTAGTTPITGGPGFSLTIDGGLVPRNPEDALRAGSGDGIPLLIGTTTEEYRLWFVPTGLMTRLGVIFLGAARLKMRIGSAVMRAYRAERRGASPAELLGALATDLLLRVPANRLADDRLTRGAASWLYEFAWRSPVGDLGAAHAVELGFVFDNLDSDDSRRLAGPTAPQKLAGEMHCAWLQFAQTGDPGWPEWDARRPVRVFDAPLTRTVLAPREAERASWPSEP